MCVLPFEYLHLNVFASSSFSAPKKPESKPELELDEELDPMQVRAVAVGARSCSCYASILYDCLTAIVKLAMQIVHFIFVIKLCYIVYCT